MRPQKLLIAATAMFAGTLAVNAGNYTESVNACENAIGDRLGISEVDARYKIKKIKSRGRFQDINFNISVFDENHPVQSVKVACRAKPTGEIVAIEFDQESLPASIAIN